MNNAFKRIWKESYNTGISLEGLRKMTEVSQWKAVAVA
jgi:hypothetical protein